jgi:hypothetical protein
MTPLIFSLSGKPSPVFPNTIGLKQSSGVTPIFGRIPHAGSAFVCANTKAEPKRTKLMVITVLHRDFN